MLFVRGVHQGGSAQTGFLAILFRGENVAFERAFALDFTGSSHLETLLGAGVCFHFWHGARKIGGANVVKISVVFNSNL